MPDYEGYFDGRGATARRLPPSKRELECIRYLSHGLTEAETADAMGTAYSTVTRQVQMARQKLGAKNAAHAVAIALRLGLID